jgi:TIR domain
MSVVRRKFVIMADRITRILHGAASAGRHVTQRVADWLYGYDFFISYRHLSAERYATRLYSRLQETKPKLRAFLDQSEEGFTFGGDLARETRRAVRSSVALVVLVEKRIFERESFYVPLEVREFAQHEKLIIPLDIDGSLRRAREDTAEARAIAESTENSEMLATLIHRLAIEVSGGDAAEPSDEVVVKLKSSLRTIRRTTRRAQAIAIAAILFVGLVAVALLINQSRNLQETYKRASQTAAQADQLLRDDPTQLERTAIIDAFSMSLAPLLQSDIVARKVLALLPKPGLRFQISPFCGRVDIICEQGHSI